MSSLRTTICDALIVPSDTEWNNIAEGIPKSHRSNPLGTIKASQVVVLNEEPLVWKCKKYFVWMQSRTCLGVTTFSGSTSTLLSFVGHMLKTNYIAIWKNDVYITPKCINYKIFKTQHEWESYLCNLPEKYVNCLVNYRMCNNRLPIETGIWVGLERNQRVCNLCYNGDIGDEWHYIFRCSYFSVKRNTILPSQTLRMLTP